MIFLTTVDEQEAIVLSVAAGQMARSAFEDWLRIHIFPI
jgi:hypothetical protein